MINVSFHNKLLQNMQMLGSFRKKMLLLFETKVSEVTIFSITSKSSMGNLSIVLSIIFNMFKSINYVDLS